MPFSLTSRPKTKHRRRLVGGESLEDRRLLAFDPSPFEQEQLEHINRMRMDPAGELAIWFDSLSPLNTFEPDGPDEFHPIQDALNHFGVSSSALQTQWAGLIPAPPLAWNENLYDAATLHTTLSVEQNLQAHRVWEDTDGDGVKDPDEDFIEPELADRIEDAGYMGSLFLENVYAFAETMMHGHAGFAIDWGEGPNGMQDPPGHRINIMSDDVQEIGVGVIDNSENIGPDDNETVGPFIITQEFGSRPDYTRQILGVVYQDGKQSSPGYYEAGEGFPDVSITVVGDAGTFTTQTMSAGGYQVEVPAGTYEVIASDPLFGTYGFGNIVVGDENVKVDFSLPDAGRGFPLGGEAANISPIAGDDTADIDGSGVIDVLDNDSDPDGSLDPSSVEIVTPPSSGSVSINSQTGEITYTGGGATSDSFSYRVRDDDGASAEATVNVNVLVANVPPVASDASFTVNEDTSETRSLASFVTDSDGTIDWTSFQIVQQPTRGTVTFSASTQSFTYLGQQDFSGTDSFEYRVSDNNGAESNVATVDLTVVDVNDAPTAANDVAATVSDGSRQIPVYLNDSDPDGNPANGSVEIVDPPQDGNAVPNGASVTYTAPSNFVGAETFTYRISDDSPTPAPSNTATVTVYVADPTTPWTNPVEPLDVDGDTVIGPIDAISVINFIPLTELPIPSPVPGLENAPLPFLDVTANGQVDPLDALLIINALPSNTAALAPLSGRASATPNESMTAVPPMPMFDRAKHASSVDVIMLRDTAIQERPTRSIIVDSALSRWTHIPTSRRTVDSSGTDSVANEELAVDVLLSRGDWL